MTQKGKYRSRQAQRYLRYKDTVGWAAKDLYKGDPYAGPVGVTVYYYAPPKRPADLDNILKSLCDGLNKIVWVDDKQVASLTIEHIITDELYERVEVIVSTWDHAREEVFPDGE